MSSPTSRTLELFRQRGWLACIVERHNAYINVKNDAFGIGDILACHQGPPPWIMLAQCTSGSNVGSHIEKIRIEPRTRDWLKSGGCIYIYGWRKQELKGKRARWIVREIEVTLDVNDKLEFLEVE